MVNCYAGAVEGRWSRPHRNISVVSGVGVSTLKPTVPVGTPPELGVTVAVKVTGCPYTWPLLLEVKVVFVLGSVVISLALNSVANGVTP